MNQFQSRALLLTVPFLFCLNSASAYDEARGVKVTKPKGVDVTVSVVTETGDPDGISNIYHEQELSGSASDVPGDADAENNVYNDSRAYSVTYDVEATATLSAGSVLQARGVATVNGRVKVQIKDNHGIAAAIASSKAVAKVGGLTASEDETRGAAVTETGTHNSSGTFMFWGTGGGGSVNVTEAGTNAKIEDYAETDATTWVQASAGVVTASWRSGIHLTAQRGTSSGSANKATAEAETRAFALGEIRFRIVTPPPAPDEEVPDGPPNTDPGGGSGTGGGSGNGQGQN